MNCARCNDFACTDTFSYSLLSSTEESRVVEWMKNHGLLYKAVTCAKQHAPLPCNLVGEHWICPERKKCRGKLYYLQPLLTAFKRRTAKQVLHVLYGMSCRNGREQIALECQLSARTVTNISHILESMISHAHDIRTIEAAGTINHMQKDETCFSTQKKGAATNHVASVRMGHNGCM